MSNLHQVGLTKDEIEALIFASKFAKDSGAFVYQESLDHLIGGLCELKFVFDQIVENNHE